MGGGYVQRIFIVTLIINQLLEIYSFEYQHLDEWNREYPACTGKRQSPVNIDTNFILEEIENPIRFLNQNVMPKRMILKNSGHTVVVTSEWSRNEPKMVGGPLNGTYILDSFHFHWGQQNNIGSEHTFNGKRYSLEMHMVHYKEDYGSLKAAADKVDGLSVIGLIFDVGSKDHGSSLIRIVKKLSKVTKVGQETSIKEFPLSNFELNDENTFITYLGSLTTPPCSQNVAWLLSTKIRRVTVAQMEAFRKIDLDYGDKDNYRPAQTLNDRVFKTVHGVKEQ